MSVTVLVQSKSSYTTFCIPLAYLITRFHIYIPMLPHDRSRTVEPIQTTVADVCMTRQQIVFLPSTHLSVREY